jgi:hypothetical protein
MTMKRAVRKSREVSQRFDDRMIQRFKTTQPKQATLKLAVILFKLTIYSEVMIAK